MYDLIFGLFWTFYILAAPFIIVKAIVEIRRADRVIRNCEKTKEDK